MGFLIGLLLFLIAFGLPSRQATAAPPASAKTIHAGPLTLDVYVGNRTAHVFHVVDQIASWSPFCHAQYRRYWEKAYGPFTPEETALLAEHARLRQRRGWGSLEPIFYTPSDLDRALANPRLGASDANTERRVFAAFAPRIERLMATESNASERFAAALETKRPELEAFAIKAARLTGTKTLRLPVYLMANPDDYDIGGGYNGNRLTLEVPRKTDAFPTFLHEVFHGFLEPRKPALEGAVKGVPGLDSETLNEGLAYALSPGLFHDGGREFDPLRLQVGEDFKGGKRLSEPYTRFNRFGLALRPLLRQSLDDPHVTLNTLLPRAVDTWRAVRELSRAVQPAEPLRIVSFGPSWQTLNTRAASMGYWLKSYSHTEAFYRQALADSPKGTTVFLLIAGDSVSKVGTVPVSYRDLLPKLQETIDAALSRGESIETEGKARGFRTILLAAPTVDALKSLIEKTKFLVPAPLQTND